VIQGVNLIPEEIKRQWRLKRLRTVFISIAVAYIACLGLVYANQLSVLEKKKGEVRALEDEKAALIAKNVQYGEILTKINDTKRREVDLKRRLAIVSSLVEDHISWSTVLKTLSLEVPRRVWLRSLSTSDKKGEGKTVKFLGSALSHGAVADFVFMLENSAFFHEVNLSYTQKKEFNTNTIYDFEVFAGLRKETGLTHE
jgi:Tfp pilus assembly protein PilN